MDKLIEIVLKDRKIRRIVPKGDVDTYVDRRGERKFTYRGQAVRMVLEKKDDET